MGSRSTLRSATVDDAVKKIRCLIDVFQGLGATLIEHGEPEHALESAVVRGAAVVSIGGRKLTPIGETHTLVARGSQIPTLWAPGTEPRYLDALLRDERVPWSVEMKVNAGGGYGAYLRHATGQAVLYRHYLRTTAALANWFEGLGMDQAATRAAVVYPRPAPEAEVVIAPPDQQSPADRQRLRRPGGHG